MSALEIAFNSLERTANRIADERNEFKRQRDALLEACNEVIEKWGAGPSHLSISERNRLLVKLCEAANKAKGKPMSEPNPKTFPTEGPRSMQFTAYDPNTFDVCADGDCKCGSAKGNIRGFGSTEQEALTDFWQQWEEFSALSEPCMRQSEMEGRAAGDGQTELGERRVPELSEGSERVLPRSPEPTFAGGRNYLARVFGTVLALCETLTPEEREARNERMREQMYDRRTQ